jgi:hypothetical protein
MNKKFMIIVFCFSALLFGQTQILNPHYKEIENKKFVKENITYIPIGEGMRYPNSVWGSIGYASEGLIYVMICDHVSNSYIYEYNIKTDKVHCLGDIMTVLSLKGYHNRQPKIHTPILQHTESGLLYFGTDAGDRAIGATWDHILEGYAGGYLATLNPTTKEVTNLGMVMPHRGMKSLLLDSDNSFLYTTIPENGIMIKYDIKRDSVIRLGRLRSKDTPRTMFLDKWNNVYTGTTHSNLVRYNVEKDTLEYFNVRIPGGLSQVSYGPGRESIVSVSSYTGIVTRYTPKKDGPGTVDSLADLFSGERMYIRNLNRSGDRLYLVVNEREEDEIADKKSKRYKPHLFVFDINERKIVKKKSLDKSIRLAFGHPILDKEGYCYTVGFSDHIQNQNKGEKKSAVHIVKFHPKDL